MKSDAKSEEFHSKRCYELYLYGVELAERVNQYVKKGYLVIHDGEVFKSKFAFRTSINNTPCIGEDNGKGKVSMVWIGCSYDTNGKVWLSGDGGKKRIQTMFSTFKFVLPQYIEKFKFK